MKTITIEQTFWEKDHLALPANILKDLLKNNFRVQYKDPDTNKSISCTARKIAEVCEYYPQYDEYVFPISICS